MITGFGLVCLNVLDLDTSKAFYVDVLGFDLVMDAVAEGIRWVLVAPPSQPQTPMLLVEPGPPLHDPATEEQLRTWIAAGRMSMGALATDDCRATHAALVAKGVEFTEEPHERFYGIDAAFRDPSGNFWRLTQPKQPGDITPKPMP